MSGVTMADPSIVILAGGVSSRMKQSMHTQAGTAFAPSMLNMPKAMLPVGKGGRPFLDYLLTNIERAGYRRVVIIVGEHDEHIRRFYEHAGGSERFPQLSISFVEQPIPAGRTKPLGTADALLRALEAMPQWEGQDVTVCNADNLYSPTALGCLLADEHAHAMVEYDRAALDFPPERIAAFAVVLKDDEGFLTDIIEKPTSRQLKRARDAHGRIGVSMNLWRFRREEILPFLRAVPLHPVRQEKELPLAVRMMVERRPKSVYCISRSEHVPDLTSAHDIERVRQYLRKEFGDF